MLLCGSINRGAEREKQGAERKTNCEHICLFFVQARIAFRLFDDKHGD